MSIAEEGSSSDEASSSDQEQRGPSQTSSMNDFSSLEQDSSGSSKFRGKGKKKAVKKGGVDLYALLGLQLERFMATPEAIKLAYRRSALLHHPDKQGIEPGDEAGKQAAEDRFKAIQEAYETLSDPARRREFDSLDDFDDSLPGTLEEGADFYKVFGSVFARNARWAAKKPVPSLGEDGTPYAEVDRFYDYWYGFKSWREFPHPDEEDVEGAEGRDHRRWIERFNAKLREQGRKAEARRVRELVESAYRQDPRLARRREEERAAKAARKAAREAERNAERDARERAERERAEEAAAARKREAAERKALRNERAALRRLVDGNAALREFAGEEGAEKLAPTMALAELRALNAVFRDNRASDEAKVAALGAQMGALKLELDREREARAAAAAAAERAAAERAAREAARRAEALAAWSEEEVRLLQKALDKWPPGTARRWEVIQGYVRTRSAEEITIMVKHGLKARAAAAVREGFQIASKRQANTVIHSEATDRITSFTDVQVAVGGGKEANKEEETSQPEQQAWSESEELALIKALKVVKKDAEDRWAAVAELVPGKTKAQCFLRFKEMKAAHKAKAGGA
ncbi:hypothetical protein QBZ16_003504 [Prototheca wickerhamii]|uniref:Uncharacterized protein n=1 Tax=Prototheca wickerhamii TaxID=3111 RepID=A0AAD9IHQ0_PROWI|nr:hypothetical protein QBZ16_003504 [Prototheca wickerhamii]